MSYDDQRARWAAPRADQEARLRDGPRAALTGYPQAVDDTVDASATSSMPGHDVQVSGPWV